MTNLFTYGEECDILVPPAQHAVSLLLLQDAGADFLTSPMTNILVKAFVNFIVEMDQAPVLST